MFEILHGPPCSSLSFSSQKFSSMSSLKRVRIWHKWIVSHSKLLCSLVTPDLVITALNYCRNRRPTSRSRDRGGKQSVSWKIFHPTNHNFSSGMFKRRWSSRSANRFDISALLRGVSKDSASSALVSVIARRAEAPDQSKLYTKLDKLSLSLCRRHGKSDNRNQFPSLPPSLAITQTTHKGVGIPRISADPCHKLWKTRCSESQNETDSPF